MVKSKRHKQNKFLVSGGAGFIGSNLVEKLINGGNDVYIIDDFSSGYEKNLNGLPYKSLTRERVQNVKDGEIESIDGIFHLAAQASVPYSLDNFYDSSKNNMLSSLKVFSWAKKQNIPVVYASSSAVYGDLPLGNDMEEKFDILSPYAQDKLMLEHYAKMFWNIYNVPSIGLRFFNVYGPRQDATSQYSGVISIFIDRLLQQKPVIVNGGYQTRDFIFVEDVIRILIKSMSNILANKSYNVFNVGTGVSIDIDFLLKTIAGIIQIKPEVINKELPQGDPEKSSGTYDHLQNSLSVDIKDFMKLKDGLMRTIDYVRKNCRR